MRRSHRLALLLIFGAAGSGSAQESMLRPGDAVRILVWQQAEFSGEFIVAADSTIQHPLYREVKIAGVPLNEAEQRIRVFLGRFQENPRFAFEPLFRVFIGGEVAQPSQYAFPRGTSLGAALVRAGWLTERGDPARVRVVRDGVESVVDLSDTDSELLLMPVRSGDRIAVDRRRNVFREYVLPGVSFVGGVAAIIRFFVN